MARGSTSEFGDLELFYVRIIGLKADSTKTHFSFSQKNEDENAEDKYPVVDIQKEFEGVLENIEVEEFEKKDGKKVKKVVMFIADRVAKEMYKLEFGLSFVSRGILNGLAGCSSIGKINMRCYFNKEGMASVFLRNNGEKTEWAHSWDEQKAMITESEQRVDGELKMVKDYWDLNQFFLNEVIPNEIQPKITPYDNSGDVAAEQEAREAEPQTQQQEVEQESNQGDPPTNEGDEIDDLPF
jgi:hypothetical protein